jgi:hypothetical protein
MNTQNLINLLNLETLEQLTEAQLLNLLAQAYSALAELEGISIEHIKLQGVIRRIELRLAEIKAQPRPEFHPRFIP